MNLKNKKWKILVVDDEADIRDILDISLTDMGYEVCLAADAGEAMQIYTSFIPDIVLADIKMPGIDGIELLKRIKQENSDTEVIMITGHGDMDLAIKSLKNKASDFITKPVSVDVLDIALKKVCEKIIMKQQLKDYTQKLEALLHEKIELQDHLSSLGLMIGSISHGLRSMTGVLDGGMYLLESGLNRKNMERTEEGLKIVSNTVGRIRKTVMDILFYAKKRDLKWERVSVLSFAEDMINSVVTKAKEHNIELICDFSESVGELDVDQSLVHSALLNIFDNAVDACVKDKAKAEHKINFSIRSKKNNIIFEISDNGTGMDNVTLKQIFNLFFSSKGNKGTGLGLFISQKAIRQHGGDIQVKSKKGEGTQFYITIPKNLKGN